MGQPLEQGLRGCLVATQLGRLLGIDAAGMAQTATLSLLRFVGCTADSHTAADFFDDEIDARSVTTPLVYAHPAESMRAMFRITAGDSTWQRAMTSFSLLATGWPRFRAGAAAHCEVAKVLAGRLGFDEDAARPGICL
jgi:hypothetical protein